MKYLLRRRQKEIESIRESLAPAFEKFDLVNDGYSLDIFDASYKLKEKSFPYSCTHEEGLIIYKAIKNLASRVGMR